MSRRHWAHRCRPLSKKPQAVANRAAARRFGARLRAALARELPNVATATDEQIDAAIEAAWVSAVTRRPRGSALVSPVDAPASLVESVDAPASLEV
jgi:hypothetical protein